VAVARHVGVKGTLAGEEKGEKQAMEQKEAFGERGREDGAAPLCRPMRRGTDSDCYPGKNDGRAYGRLRLLLWEVEEGGDLTW
jgi:hypothetical protein